MPYFADLGFLLDQPENQMVCQRLQPNRILDNVPLASAFICREGNIPKMNYHPIRMHIAGGDPFARHAMESETPQVQSRTPICLRKLETFDIVRPTIVSSRNRTNGA